MKLRQAGLIAAAAAMIGLAGAPTTVAASPAAMGHTLGGAAFAATPANATPIPVQAEHGGYGRNLAPGSNGAVIWLPNNRNTHVGHRGGHRYHHRRWRERYHPRPRYHRPPAGSTSSSTPPLCRAPACGEGRQRALPVVLRAVQVVSSVGQQLAALSRPAPPVHIALYPLNSCA